MSKIVRKSSHFVTPNHNKKHLTGRLDYYVKVMNLRMNYNVQII